MTGRTAKRRTRPTRRHTFVIMVSGPPTVEQARALVELPDRPLVERRLQHGHGRIVFERQASPDLRRTVLDALRDLEAVGLRPVRVVHGDWVTLGDIAGRIGRSREAVRLWTLGRVGPGGFPLPQNLGSDTLFYSWVEVATWLRDRMGFKLPRPETALVEADWMLRLGECARRR